MLTIAVEGKTDQKIIAALLANAGVHDTSIIVANGSIAPSTRGWQRIEKMSSTRPLIVVYDQDSGSVGDAVSANQEVTDIVFCPAIPTVDAWLFADSAAFFNAVGSKADAFLGRMPLPEQLPYPKFLKSTMLRDQRTLEQLLTSINISIAGSRSPSLKHFINAARRHSNLDPLSFEQPIDAYGQLNREVLRNLISEVYPSEKTLFRSASGNIITAEQMMQEITDGTELGREYSSDILRVARDLLARQAQKKLNETDRKQ
ncbi:hypothetical protein [Novosphingobium resinovorum]|uniref:hypothetical protein n=1 Tax=Novosphingobium resinovorum TaxID=158500 RepID=UPI002ED2A7CA|nr:hypothetical protein [Novosphingobium resinovorum]